mmetsp:Transcript_17515/g.36754  ORF Transcript_17515/g.36754 Transcript_17515/m.36754 type:complete len:410 (-) Transcript_17515:234-1463(-)
MAFAPFASTEDSPSQAFLANNNDEDSDFATLDSMTPRVYNASHHYGQQQPQQQTSQHFGAIVSHSLYNNQGTSSSGTSADGSMNSGGTGDNNIGRVGDGVNGGFSGVSESLFDRIRARAEQQQKPQQSSYPSSAVQPSQQQQLPQQQVKSAFVSQQRQQPTMEYERDPSVGGAFAHNHENIPNPSTNEATYTFSPPSSELPSQNSQQYPQNQQQQQQPPHVPTYGPSRNDPHYSSHAGSHNHGHGGPMTSFQDKAAMAWEQTSSTFKSLWEKASSGAQTIGALAREARAGNGGSGGMRGGGGGYNNNFLLRSEIDDDDEMERGVGGGPNASQLRHQHHQQHGAATDTVMAGSNTSGAGSGAVVGDPAYSMVTYAKTFCLDVFGFVRDMPLWGKVFFVLVLLWVLYAFKG